MRKRFNRKLFPTCELFINETAAFLFCKIQNSAGLIQAKTDECRILPGKQAI